MVHPTCVVSALRAGRLECVGPPFSGAVVSKLGWFFLLLCAGCRCLPHSGTVASRSRRTKSWPPESQFFHTGTPVVLWMDPGGYDAYRVERRFSPLTRADWEDSKADVKTLTRPNRYSARTDTLTSNEVERVRGGGWDLPLLQQVVDQFVIHFDVCGISRQCFKVLQDERDLSVHFMLDVDGTIYQTLDLKERALHATVSNNRSVGIEIANMERLRSARDQHPRSMVSDGYARADVADDSGAFRSVASAGEGLYGAARAARADSRRHPGRIARAIRLHPGTIRSADQINRDALQGLSENPL